eukprot:m51a1_g10710 hypothetical protein (487) ;mRNA; r:183524-188038
MRLDHRPGVSVITVLLVLLGIIAGAGVVLEVLWFTARDTRIEWPEYYYERSFSGNVGPGGCLVVLIPDDGFFAVSVASSALEFTVVNQNSTQCREPRNSHRNIEAMSRNRSIRVGSANRQGNYVVINALQDDPDGNVTTFISRGFYMEPKGDRLRDTVFLFVPPIVYIVLGVLFARDSIIEDNAHTHLIDGDVGPEDCLVIPTPEDGFVAVSLVSSKLEFSVVIQSSTLCREPRESHWEMEAVIIVTVLIAMLLLSGGIAGAGAVLEALWYTAMDSIIQVSAHTHLIDAEVGPEDCLVIPSPVDGFVAVSLVSSKLEFSVVHQHSTLCRTVDAAVGPDDCLPVLVRATGLVGVDLTSTDLEFSVASQASPQCAEGSSRATRDISAVSLRRGLVLGSRSELLEGDYVVVRAVQDEDGGNATTRVHGVVTVSPTGELLWRSFFLYVAKSGLVALGALLAVVCCALLFLVIRRRIAGDDEQGQPLLTRP